MLPCPVAFSEPPSDTTWLENAQFDRIFRAAKFSTWLENAQFDRIFRAAKFSTWLENALGSIHLRARSTNERREGGFIIGAEFHEFFGRGVPGSGAIIVEALLQILTFQ